MNMQLSESDKQKILTWMSTKCPQMRCVCCGLGRWNLLEFATLPIGFDTHTTRFFYHHGMPQITLVCAECGHLVFFSSAVIGFKPDEPPIETIPAEDPKA